MFINYDKNMLINDVALRPTVSHEVPERPALEAQPGDPGSEFLPDPESVLLGLFDPPAVLDLEQFQGGFEGLMGPLDPLLDLVADAFCQSARRKEKIKE